MKLQFLVINFNEERPKTLTHPETDRVYRYVAPALANENCENIA